MRTILKYLIYFIVFFTFLNALVFVLIGIKNSLFGIKHFFLGGAHGDSFPALEILESLDLFLVALVFIVFATGIHNIFIPKSENEIPSENTNSKHILNVNSFSNLKLLLWQTILTTLLVHFISIIIRSSHDLNWTLLIFPISILLLSVSLYFFNLIHQKNDAK